MRAVSKRSDKLDKFAVVVGVVVGGGRRKYISHGLIQWECGYDNKIIIFVRVGEETYGMILLAVQ